ncbi:MAG: hypothetical protein Q9166_004493 [cf. Caloplaca sp. 2 TL-2023]
MPSIPSTRIRDELLNLFLPAHDAIAIPLTNIFFNLARHPHVYNKLRNEILSADHPTSRKQLGSLQYLQAVIKETLRLFPGAGTNERVALSDTILPSGGGPNGNAPVFVKKGDTVNVNFYCLQRRTDIWGADATEWRPGRWLRTEDGRSVVTPPWSHLPFAGGPRVCPGSEQGMDAIAYTVAKMVETFVSCENRGEKEEFEDLYRVVTVSRDGAKVGLFAA